MFDGLEVFDTIWQIIILQKFLVQFFVLPLQQFMSSSNVTNPQIDHFFAGIPQSCCLPIHPQCEIALTLFDCDLAVERRHHHSTRFIRLIH